MRIFYILSHSWASGFDISDSVDVPMFRSHCTPTLEAHSSLFLVNKQFYKGELRRFQDF